MGSYLHVLLLHIDFVENDIAVIEDGESVYVLSILSGKLQDNGTAVQQIINMTKCIYEQRNGLVEEIQVVM